MRKRTPAVFAAPSAPRAGWGLLAAVALLAPAGAARADYRDDVGHTRLAAELGAGLPNGSNIPVVQVEAPEAPANYMPDAASPEFAGKTIVNAGGGSTGVSSHATWVGSYFYGLSTSMATGITAISAYDVNTWIGFGFLRCDNLNVEPRVETNRIQNHSYIGSSASATTIVRRLDYAINRDGFVAVVGLNNGSGTVVPDVPSHTYNAITVGRSDGEHSRGGTRFDEAGRVKPDLVVPLDAASVAVPTVGAAAALLLQAADNHPAWSNAARPQSVKALLLAGATKEAFPTWDRTEARPLDEVYGAGQLDVYNSYRLLEAGQQPASATSLVARMGWDFRALATATNALYFFEVPTGYAMTRLSAILTWHRVLTNGPLSWFDPEGSLTDLDLRLRAATNFSPGALLDQSTSAVDNVEHVYRVNLPAGRYALEVTSAGAADYALAWYSRTARIPAMSSAGWSNETFYLTADVSSNIAYAVEASTNLLLSNGWSRLATNVPAGDTLVYTDNAASNFVQRFYRLVADP